MQAEVVRKTYVRFYRSGSNPEHGTIYPVDKGGCSFGAPIPGDDMRDIGVFNNPHEDREVGSRDLRQLEVPSDVFAVEFFDRYEVEVEDDGETIKLVSKNLNFSKQHFWGGQILSRGDVERLKFEKRDILMLTLPDNMDFFHWKHVVLTPQGDYKPFGTEAVLVDPGTWPPNAEAIAA